MTQTIIRNILALDVGDVRVGVALTNTVARLPRPLTTLIRDESFWNNLQQLITENTISEIVVGLPRNLNGDDTQQTKATRAFVTELQNRFQIKVHLQDEALTSKKAETELTNLHKPYSKEAVDALAATYILEDYFREAQ